MKLSTSIVIMYVGLLLSAVLQARTLDDSLEELYEAKPYLRPHSTHHDDQYDNVGRLYKRNALVDWNLLHSYIDFIALAYLGMHIYITYNTVYQEGGLNTCKEYKWLSWLKNSGLCGTFILAMIPAVAKVYIYRMLAHASLNVVRYGVVTPISWIKEQLMEFNSHENISRYRVIHDD